MALSWDDLKPHYAYIVEWWHNKGTRPFRRSMTFGRELWSQLSRKNPAPAASESAEAVDAKLWVLTLALLWRAYLIDWGGTHPIEADDWPTIAEWIDLDVWQHFGYGSSPTDRSPHTTLQDALTQDFEDRAVDIVGNLGLRCVRNCIGVSESMMDETSLSNMEEILSELARKERVRAARLRPFLTSASELIVERLSRKPQDIFSLPPRRFEEVLAELLAESGYSVILTPATRDGGFDIIVRNVQSENPGELCLIEATRYRRDRKVGVEAVRSLYGALTDKAADRAILVATSAFTKDAVAFQRRHPYQITLQGYSDLLKLMRTYGRLPKKT
jgi:hypothetical protein